MRSRIGVCLSAALSFTAAPGVAQRTTQAEEHDILLVVVHAVTGAALPGVIVSNRIDGSEGETNSAGEVTLTGVSGSTLFLDFTKPGFESSIGMLHIEEATAVSIELTPDVKAAVEGGPIVAGWVRDVDTDRALEGVRVSVTGGRTSTLTGPRGEFLLNGVKSGQVRLTFNRLGYEDRDVDLEAAEGRRIELEVVLSSRPIPLDPIEVSVEPRSLRLEISGFYDRRRLELGQFLSLEQIEKRTVSKTTDLFNDFRGIRFITNDGAGREEAVAFHRGQVVKSVIEARRICYPAVWIDDVRVAAGGGEPAVLNRYVTPLDIAGIEVYASAAQIPSRYSGTGSACGAILVWTR